MASKAYTLTIDTSLIGLGATAVRAQAVLRRATVVDSFVIVPDLKHDIDLTSGIGTVDLLANAQGSVYELTAFNADGNKILGCFFVMPDADTALSDLELLTAWGGESVNANAGNGARRRTIRYTSNTTLKMSDAGCIIEFDSTSPITVTIPNFLTVPFRDGAFFDFVNINTGVVTFVSGSGVTLNTTSATLDEIDSKGFLYRTEEDNRFIFTNAPPADWDVLRDKPANLTSLAGLVGAVNKFPVFSNIGVMILKVITDFAYSFLAAADATAAKALLLLAKADVGLSNVDNTSDVNKPVSTAQEAANTLVLTQASDYADSSAKFIQNGAGALIWLVRSKLREQWSVKDFGAIGDGTVHTVLEWYTIGATYYRGYANLTAVQVDYPHVTASTDSVDWAAIQQAIKLLPLNTADTVALTPQGFANGGCVQIPRGRYVVNKKITMQRGTRIVGESHESTQLLSKIAADSVLEYLDNGGYVPDEICLENFSIWQDASIVATTSAAIIVKRGTYPTSALQTIVKNVFIQGTYRGVFIEAGIGCSFDNVSATKCVSHGFDINSGGNSAYSTTSTTLKNCYASLNGGNGINVLGSSYISLQGCASDSNTGYGYRLETANAFSVLACGAERNVAGNFYVKDISGGVMQIHCVTQSGAVNGLTLNNAIGLTLVSPNFLADVGNTGNGVFFEAAARPLFVITPTFLNFANKYSNVNTVQQVGTTDGQILGGDTQNWTFGATASKDTSAMIALAGAGGVATEIGLKSAMSFTFTGAARNAAMYAQVITANTAVTYPLVIGLYVPNASKGAASTITRAAGAFISEQTVGANANANIMIDTGGGIPVGNWSIYNASTRANYHGGSQTWKPAASATPANNGDLTFEATSNTSLTVKLKGTDGTVRSVVLTLA